MTTAQRRQRAIQLHTEGLSNRAIAKRLNVSHTLINRYISSVSNEPRGNTRGNSDALAAKLLQRFGGRAFNLSALEHFCKDSAEYEKAVQLLTEKAHAGEKIGAYRVNCLSFSLYRE